MTDELEEYVFCWRCDRKIEIDSQVCRHCKKPQFDKEGNEIICQEQYEESLNG